MTQPLEHEEEPVEEFLYPGAENEQKHTTEEQLYDLELTLPTPPSHQPGAKLELPSVPETAPSEVVTHPLVTIIPPPSSTLIPLQTTPSKAHPTPAQLETIQAAAAEGNLNKLQQLFRTILQAGDFEPFALANDASPRTGLTALHAAASRGHVEAVKWRTSIDRHGMRPLINRAVNSCARVWCYSRY